MLELTSIDFIEDLEQNEDVEEDGVVLASFFVPVLHTDGRWDVKNLGAYINLSLYL